MTLRALYLMAMAKQREAWARTATIVAWLVNHNGFVKEKVCPADVVPKIFRYPEPPPPKLTPEEQADAARWGWAYLNQFMKQRHRKTVKLKAKKPTSEE